AALFHRTQRPARQKMIEKSIFDTVANSAQRPWRTVVICLVVAIAALAFAVTHFDMTTDTSELISPKVE
ncbi:hypothetical protein ACSTLX_25655, partial [Vibrio parahaemolyticus]